MASDDLHSGSEKLLPAISGLVMTEYIGTKTEGISRESRNKAEPNL